MGLRPLVTLAVRARILGPARAADDAGMATVEAALAVLSLTVVTLLLASVFAVIAAQLRVNDAARITARTAATGADGVALGQQSAPGASIEVQRGGGVVAVQVRQSVQVPLLQDFEVAASAQAADEAVLGEIP